MKLVFTVYSAFFLVTTLVSFFVAFLAWQRRSVKGATELGWLMIAVGLGAFWVIFETAALSMGEKIFLSKLEYIGGLATPVLYLIFVLRYIGKDKLITTRNILLLFVIPFITLLFTLTNEKHKLVWSGFSAISAETNLMQYYHGLVFWIGYIAYTYLMLLLAILYLFSFILRSAKVFRPQGLIVLAGGLFPLIVSAVYVAGINPVAGLDLAPISITLSGVLAAYAIFNFRFLDLVPVARETLVETLQDGILVLDAQNRIQDINKSAIASLGIKNKNIIGSAAGLVQTSATQLLAAAINLETDGQVQIRQNNEIKTYRIIKQPIIQQTGSRLVIIRDVTERVAWQQELKEGEERYRNMYNMFRLMADNTEDFLWAKDLNNKYTFCNKTMCERLLIAETVEEPIGKTDLFFASREREAHPENPDWHTFEEIDANSDSTILRERKSKQFDVSGNVKGVFLFLDVNKAPIRDETGNIIGVVGTGRDVTSTKQLEAEKTAALELLRISEDDLRELNAEKDKFFSIIAHDLRSPFSGFLGLTEIMAKGLKGLTLEEIQKMASEMRKSAANLYRLLGNLLEWSRMQRGLITYDPKSLHLMLKINEAMAIVRETADKKEISIHYDIPGDLMVFADDNMFKGIIRNLVGNAVKFTQRGGHINVSAKPIVDNQVEISIRDTGIGMSRAITENLFKLSINTNRKGTDGEYTTGLGLIICKDFIEKNNGKLRVESEPGKGSAFSFTLPGYISKEEKPVMKQNMPDIAGSYIGKPLKILIVEDDETSEMLISIAVRTLSKEVLKVARGADAIETCRDHPDIDLILMDIKMPEMDGYETTRQIRQFNKNVFIIAQTAFGLAEEKEKAIEAGCNEYIAKPLDIPLLRNLIQNHFKRSKSDS